MGVSGGGLRRQSVARHATTSAATGRTPHGAERGAVIGLLTVFFAGLDRARTPSVNARGRAQRARVECCVDARADARERTRMADDAPDHDVPPDAHDREAILARRRRFVVVALSSLALGGCAGRQAWAGPC